MTAKLEDRNTENIIFDYIYKEVSAQSGEGVTEAIQKFGEVLYKVYKDKKRRKKVIQFFKLLIQVSLKKLLIVERKGFWRNPDLQ